VWGAHYCRIFWGLCSFVGLISAFEAVDVSAPFLRHFR